MKTTKTKAASASQQKPSKDSKVAVKTSKGVRAPVNGHAKTAAAVQKVNGAAKVSPTKVPPAKVTPPKLTPAKLNGSAKVVASKTALPKAAPAKAVNGAKPAKALVGKGFGANKSVVLKAVAEELLEVVAEIAVAEEVVEIIVPDINYEEGDKVVYPAHGVGVIDAIQLRKISGSEHRFYMITIIETGMKIMVPVSQSKTVGLRRVVDCSTVDKVYDILRNRNVTIDNQTWNRRYREYSQKIKTGSVLEIATVIRDLSVLKSDKELSFGERRMLDTAQGLLVKELSIAKARSEETIKAELDSLCHPS